MFAKVVSVNWNVRAASTKSVSISWNVGQPLQVSSRATNASVWQSTE